MALLELKNLVKAFGGLKAVNDVSFQVEEGEIFGLIGPNGSGKTTIFNCINNFFPITAGDVLFKGKSIKGLKTHKICQLGIGRTFQVVKPLARLTVLDNVTASAFCRVNTIKEAQIRGRSGFSISATLSSETEQAGQEPSHRRTKKAGDRPRPGHQTGLLLLDETAAGLNPSELDEAIDLIKKIRDSGITILIVEHIMKVIMTISDRIHAINFGQTIAQGTPKEVANNPAVIEAYLGEEYAQG